MNATAERTAVELTGRELVAAEVRAHLARKKLTSNSLPTIAGRTQSYWYSRLNARVAFSADDLAALSSALNVPMSEFMPDVVAHPGPDDNPPVDINTRVNPRTLVPTIVGWGHASVAQGIEHWFPVPGVARSNRVGGAIIPFPTRDASGEDRDRLAPVTPITRRAS